MHLQGPKICYLLLNIFRYSMTLRMSLLRQKVHDSRLLGIAGKLWLRALVIVVCMAGLVTILHKLVGFGLQEAATATGSIAAATVAATALLLAQRTLRDTHDWNRRHYTIEIQSRWNKEARPHLDYQSILMFLTMSHLEEH